MPIHSLFSYIRSPLRIAMMGLIAAFVVAPGFAMGDNDDNPAVSLNIPSRVERHGDAVVVTLMQTEIDASGIKTALAASVSEAPSITGFGSVMDPATLNDARSTLSTATLAVHQGEVRLSTAKQEYARQKTLFERFKSVAEKTYQDAESQQHLAEADLATARENARRQSEANRQRFGEVLATWIAKDAAELRAVLDRRTVIVQLTAVAGTVSDTPAAAQIDLPGGRALDARFLSPAPNTDTRLQGVSYFFLIDAPDATLTPGATVVGHWSTRAPSAGVSIPHSAVVLWQGKSWVYVLTGGGHFQRRQIATSPGLADGWRESEPVVSGDLLVTVGAQLLLSEEQRVGSVDRAADH